MNLMQTKLEQIYKEYIDLKVFVENENKELDNKRKEIAETVLTLETEEEQAVLYFEKIGFIHPLMIDLMQMKSQLYYFYQAYKDLTDVPKEIENELEDFKIRYTFSIKGGKKEIADKELYEIYKQQQIDILKYQPKQEA